MAYQGQTILCLNKMSLKVTVMLLLMCVAGTQGELHLFYKLLTLFLTLFPLCCVFKLHVAQFTNLLDTTFC